MDPSRISRSVVLAAALAAGSAVVLAACSSPAGSPAASSRTPVGSASTPGTVPPTITSTPATVAHPPGWIDVAWGDAQISVPPTWHVEENFACPSGRHVVALGGGQGYCTATEFGATTVFMFELPVGRITARRPRIVKVNGFVVDERAGDTEVPSLGVGIDFGRRVNTRILDTLARSPRDVALSNPSRQVLPPAAWRTLHTDGLAFAVPPTWNLTRTDTTTYRQGPCSAVTNVLADSANSVVVSKATTMPPVLFCPEFGENPPVEHPRLGLVVDAGPMAPQLVLHPVCSTRNGLRVCVQNRPAPDSVLEASISDPQRRLAQPVTIYLGLAGNGLVDRTVLDSFRPNRSAKQRPERLSISRPEPRAIQRLELS